MADSSPHSLSEPGPTPSNPTANRGLARLETPPQLARLAAVQAGVVSRKQARASGLLPESIQRRVANGIWRSSGGCLLIDPAAASTPLQIAWLLSLRAGEGAIVSGRIALEVAGSSAHQTATTPRWARLPHLERMPQIVLVPDGKFRRVPGAIVRAAQPALHRPRVLPGGLLIRHPQDALVDVLQEVLGRSRRRPHNSEPSSPRLPRGLTASSCGPLASSRASVASSRASVASSRGPVLPRVVQDWIDAALQLRCINATAVERALEIRRAKGRAGVHALNLVLRHVGAGAESEAERVLARLLRKARLRGWCAGVAVEFPSGDPVLQTRVTAEGSTGAAELRPETSKAGRSTDELRPETVKAGRSTGAAELRPETVEAVRGSGEVRPPRVGARLDFGHIDLRIAIEVDGRAFHSAAETFERDRRRQNWLISRGWQVLRFTWRQLTVEPEEVVKCIRGVIRTREREGTHRKT